MNTTTIATVPVPIAVVAVDHIVREGSKARLRHHRDVLLVPPEQERTAATVLLITDRFDERDLALMRAHRESVNGAAGFVVVARAIPRNMLLPAVGHGMVTWVARHRSNHDDVVRSVVLAAQGRAVLPPRALRALLDQIRTIQREALEPQRMTPYGLSVVELDILRLLAAGRSTLEIARELRFSERTVKYMLRELISRHGLRNRTHAVAHAIKLGAI